MPVEVRPRASRCCRQHVSICTSSHPYFSKSLEVMDRDGIVITYLVDWVDDPVDSGISSDGLVRGVNEDDLEVLVC